MKIMMVPYDFIVILHAFLFYKKPKKLSDSKTFFNFGFFLVLKVN